MAIPDPTSPSRMLRLLGYRPVGVTIARVPRLFVVSREEFTAARQASHRDGFHDALLDVLYPRWP